MAISTDAGAITNDVTLGSNTIKVSTGSVRGFTPDNYREPVQSSFDPLLFPWGPVKSQTYTFSGSAFSKTSEEKQTATSAQIPERNLRRPRRAAAPRRGQSPRESLQSLQARPRRKRAAAVRQDGRRIGRWPGRARAAP